MSVERFGILRVCLKRIPEKLASWLWEVSIGISIFYHLRLQSHPEFKKKFTFKGKVINFLHLIFHKRDSIFRIYSYIENNNNKLLTQK